MMKIKMKKPSPEVPTLEAAMKAAVAAEEAFAPETPGEAPLPPAPAQMNAPVGPPPPPAKDPETFEEIFALALKARSGRLDFAQFWASLAQAQALNRAADRLDELMDYLGARDTEDEVGSGPRLADQVTNGIVGSVLVANDELLPPGAVDLFKIQLATKLAEEIGQK